LCSGQPTDPEVWAKRVLSGTHVCIPEEAVPPLKQFIEHAVSRVGTTTFWEKLRHDYRKAFSHLHRALSRSTAMKKDKAVFTQGNASYTYSLRALKNREGGPSGNSTRPKGELSPEHPAFTGEGEDEIVVLSPRHRNKRPDITDPIRYVDKLLRELHEREPNLPVPEDFRRIDPLVNTFWFNEKIIDLIPNDNSCVVKVGGGYVMFEEYCQKYGKSTPDNFTARGGIGISASLMGGGGSPLQGISGGTTPRGGTTRSGTPKAGGVGNTTARSTLRAGTPTSSPRGMGTNSTGTMTTPRRVLVRQGRGVVLH
jgi:hypothetical protein